MNFLSSISAMFTAALKVIYAAVDFFKTKQNVETGKQLQNAETIVENQKVEREQTEVLIQDRPPSEVIKKLENGTF